MDKVIAFDLDDTLYCEKEYVWSGFRAVDTLLMKKYSMNGFYNKAIHLFNSGIRGNTFNLYLDQMNMHNDNYKIILDDMIRQYREHVPLIHLYKDARWALNDLKNGANLAIITDGYLEVQKKKVEALKLEKQVEKIVFSDSFGRCNWKPSAVPYREVMNYFGHHHSFFYIGDNISKDFITANKLGWTTIHINRGEYSQMIAKDCTYSAHHQIQSLYEIEQFIR